MGEHKGSPLLSPGAIRRVLAGRLIAPVFVYAPSDSDATDSPPLGNSIPALASHQQQAELIFLAILAMPTMSNAATPITDTLEKRIAAGAVATNPMTEATACTAVPPQQAMGARMLAMALPPLGSEIERI